MGDKSFGGWGGFVLHVGFQKDIRIDIYVGIYIFAFISLS